MMGMRRAYVQDSMLEVKKDGVLMKGYKLTRWADLKKGDIVVLIEPDGTPVDGGIEHHLIEDPWTDPDLGLHVIKTLDPCTVVHKEATNALEPDQAAAGALRGADQEGVPDGPRHPGG